MSSHKTDSKIHERYPLPNRASPSISLTKQQQQKSRHSPGKKAAGDGDGDGDDDSNSDDHYYGRPKGNGWMASTLPHLSFGIALRTALGITAVLYGLNQSHLLPRPVSSMVSRALFWPTLPITASRRIGRWITPIDDTVIMGGAPFAFLGYPQRLHDEYGVRGVVNFCEEYRGPIREYQRLGMEELYLPTSDHFEPSEEDLMSALSFLERHKAMGKKVYVHCRAGHGRSGAAVLAWILLNNPKSDLQQLNAELGKKRLVKSTLWRQPNIRALHQRLRDKGCFVDVNDEFFQRGGGPSSPDEVPSQ